MHQRGHLARGATAALRRALVAVRPTTLSQQQQQCIQQRTFRSSAVINARKNKRSGPTSESTVPKTSAVFGEEERDEDDEKEIEEWFKQMQEQQQQSGKRGSRVSDKQSHFGALEDDGDDDSDDDDDDDEETEEFLSEVDDLFALEPEEFERKMQTFDKRHPSTRRSVSSVKNDEEDEDEDEDDHFDASDADVDDYDDDEIDRATERISKKKLLKVLDDLQPGSSSRSGKNAESMALPKTKNSAPLEKKPKKVNVERISYRQERVELSVTDFVQNLILQESDSNATDVVANIVEASVAPDLRRVVLFWEPQRLNSENQTISKRKVAGIERRLQTQERWIRAQVTRHLNLKYSPNVQFKRRKDAKSDEARAKFDSEMAWLNRFSS